MGTSVPGLPIRDCAESCNSSVPRCAKVSPIDVIEKTIFEHLYLVQGLGTLYLRVKCPYVLTTPLLSDQLFLDFRAIFFNFTEIQKQLQFEGGPGKQGIDDPPNECVYVCVCTGVCVCELCAGVCVCVCVHGCVRACAGFNDYPLH